MTSPKRREALAAARADGYKQEVEELRVTVARAHLKVQQQTAEHAKHIAALQAELDARSRGEMLARTRCEAAEAELRGMRKEVQRLKERVGGLQQDGAARQEAFADGLVVRCREALQGLARHGLAAGVLGWRRRSLASSVARWQCTVQLLDATFAGRVAALEISSPGGFACAEAAAAVLGGSEGWLRDVQRGYRVRRLGNWSAGVTRASLLRATLEWRLAACALAAEDDLRDVAGRLRSAQNGMVQVLDGRAVAEDAMSRHTALARVVVGVASLYGVRRNTRDRRWSLQMGFRPWLCLLMSSRLDAAAGVGKELRGSLADGAQSSKRADALTRDMHVLRNNLAATHKKLREASADADAAVGRAAKSEEAREKLERLERASRAKTEALEREKYAAVGAARKERQHGVQLRRGVIALALRAALRRGDELRLASAVARWAVALLQPERGAPWWGVLAGGGSDEATAADEGEGRGVADGRGAAVGSSATQPRMLRPTPTATPTQPAQRVPPRGNISPMGPRRVLTSPRGPVRGTRAWEDEYS